MRLTDALGALDERTVARLAFGWAAPPADDRDGRRALQLAGGALDGDPDAAMELRTHLVRLTELHTAGELVRQPWWPASCWALALLEDRARDCAAVVYCGQAAGKADRDLWAAVLTAAGWDSNDTATEIASGLAEGWEGTLAGLAAAARTLAAKAPA